MNISDKERYELLHNISIDRTKSTDSFFNICKFTIPEQKSEHVLNTLIWSSYVIWNQKEDTVTIGEIGKKFIRKHKCKLKRDNIIEHIVFLKHIFWLIAFLFSIILNIITFLKVFDVI